MLNGVLIRALQRLCNACVLVTVIALVPLATVAKEVVTTELIATDLVAPIDIVLVPDQSGDRLILDQSGVVRVLRADNTLTTAPFLDIRDRLLPLEAGFEERGLLGFALHPQYAVNGRVFVSYSAPLDAVAPAGWNHTRVVSEFTRDADKPMQVDAGTERVLLRQDWPSRKHNGGALAFGPDGYLYIGFGDGGGIHGVGTTVLNDAFSVPQSRLHWDSFAQDRHTLFGKILRLDIDSGYPGYAIPPDNPFDGLTGKREIFAIGFRNPYRIAFDPLGDASFYVTAVAETLWESVYRVAQSGNYGWPLREGAHCFDRTTPLSPPEQCVRQDPANADWPLYDPVVEYANMSVHRDGSQVETVGIGTAVVGAIMLRDSELHGLNGQLLIADWSLDFRKPSGQLFTAIPNSSADASSLWPVRKIAELNTRIVALSQDTKGRVYLLTNENFGPYGKTGKIFQLLESTP